MVSTSTVQHINASAASAGSAASAVLTASRAIYCYAVSQRSYDTNNCSSYAALLLRPAINETQFKLRDRAVNPVACSITFAQQFEGVLAARIFDACDGNEDIFTVACTDWTSSTTHEKTPRVNQCVEGTH